MSVATGTLGEEKAGRGGQVAKLVEESLKLVVSAFAVLSGACLRRAGKYRKSDR